MLFSIVEDIARMVRCGGVPRSEASAIMKSLIPINSAGGDTSGRELDDAAFHYCGWNSAGMMPNNAAPPGAGFGRA